MKKFTINSLNKIKFFFVSRGPGETGQARALAKYIEKKGGKILFGIKEKRNLHFLKGDKNFKIFLVPEIESLKKVVEREKPQVLLFFNSKIWGGEFIEKPPFKKPQVSVTVDSNWLFNEKKYPKYPFIKWVDTHFVLFPEKIFKLGLKKFGGNHVIDSQTMKKIIPVGFIPSYKKPKREIIQRKRKEYQIKSGEKFIFSYFSGYGADHKVWAFNNLILAVERLIKKGRKIKVLYVGPTEDLDPKKLKKKWLIKREKLSSKEYFLSLACSDLVFQHQGLVTLSQAISAQIPVIANVSLIKREALIRIHFWEVKPFERAGVCKMLTKTTPIKRIARTIEMLLYNKRKRNSMIKQQRLIYKEGEKKAFEEIKKLLKQKL